MENKHTNTNNMVGNSHDKNNEILKEVKRELKEARSIIKKVAKGGNYYDAIKLEGMLDAYKRVIRIIKTNPYKQNGISN